MALGANNFKNQYENPGINTDVTIPNDVATYTVGTTAGAAQFNTSGVGMLVTVVASAVTGTLSIQLQISLDGATTSPNWINYGPASGTLAAAGSITIGIYPTNFSQAAGATPANLTIGNVGGSGTSVFLNALLPKTWRLQYIVGTTSAVVTGVYVNYSN